MLQHNNPFRRFLVGISALKRINLALARLEKATATSPSLVLFAIWVAQQNLVFASDWQISFKAFFNWHDDFSRIFSQQLSKTKHLADNSEYTDDGPLHNLIGHLNQAKREAERQEHSLLFYYYQSKQGLEKTASRQEALTANLYQVLPKNQPLNPEDINSLLSLVLDGNSLEEQLALLAQQPDLIFQESNNLNELPLT